MSNDKIVNGSMYSTKRINGNIQKAEIIYKNNYNDLKNKPTINGVVLKGNKTFEDLGITADNILNLAEVAKTGSYNDLSDKPEIPVVDVKKFYVDNELSKKVDKIDNMGLSSNDYTTTEKTKLASLENYDDTDVKRNIALNLSSIGMSKKNLLKCSHNAGYSSSNSGKTCQWVINDDYSISMTVLGTITSGVALEFATVTLPIGTYVYSVGNNVSAGITHTQLYIKNEDGSSWFANATSYETTITVTTPTTYVFKAYRNSAVTVGIVETIYPMIRLADITDDTYEPYQDDLQTQINNIIARLTALEE